MCSRLLYSWPGTIAGMFRVLGTNRVSKDMPIPQPIDPRLLAAEIEATVSEFNRLVAFATEHQIAVIGELRTQRRGDRPDRPVLAVQVVVPL